MVDFHQNGNIATLHNLRTLVWPARAEVEEITRITDRLHLTDKLFARIGRQRLLSRLALEQCTLFISQADAEWRWVFGFTRV